MNSCFMRTHRSKKNSILSFSRLKKGCKVQLARHYLCSIYIILIYNALKAVFKGAHDRESNENAIIFNFSFTYEKNGMQNLFSTSLVKKFSVHFNSNQTIGNESHEKKIVGNQIIITRKSSQYNCSAFNAVISPSLYSTNAVVCLVKR